MLFNEPKLLKSHLVRDAEGGEARFSALQRAEIAEMPPAARPARVAVTVSVLFNEPKLLKCGKQVDRRAEPPKRFSALQRAEIAEMVLRGVVFELSPEFQCSSPSRNC